MQRYTKLLVAVVQVATQGLEITYGGAHWLPVVSGALGAVLVWAVPNTETPARVNPTDPVGNSAAAPRALAVVPAQGPPAAPQGARVA